MKAIGIVRQVNDLGRVVIPKAIHTLRPNHEGDPSLTTLTPIDIFCWAIHNVVKFAARLEIAQ